MPKSHLVLQKETLKQHWKKNQTFNYNNSFGGQQRPPRREWVKIWQSFCLKCLTSTIPIQFRCGNAQLHVQNLLLVLPSLREADGVLRAFWRAVHKVGGLDKRTQYPVWVCVFVCVCWWNKSAEFWWPWNAPIFPPFPLSTRSNVGQFLSKAFFFY